MADIAPRQFAQGYEDAKLELSTRIRRALALYEQEHAPPNHATRDGIISKTVAEWLTEP